MNRNHWRRLRVAAGTALALWAGAVLAAPPHEDAEVTLPQAGKRIVNWGLDGHKGIWIEAAGGQWYYGEFLDPCLGALPDRVAFKFNPDGSLNRFSKVIVPHQRQVCAFKSFVVSAGPDAGKLLEGGI